MLRHSLADLPASRIREVANAGIGRADVLKFWFGEGDLPTPQFIRQAAIDALAAGDTFYNHNRATPRSIRELRCRNVNPLRCVDVLPEQKQDTGLFHGEPDWPQESLRSLVDRRLDSRRNLPRSLLRPQAPNETVYPPQFSCVGMALNDMVMRRPPGLAATPCIR